MLALMGDSLGCDLWHWSTDDGRGLRLALDYITQFVGRPNDWPYQEIKPANFNTTVFTYRAAAQAYGDPTLLEPLEKLADDEVAANPASVLFTMIPTARW